MEYIRLTVPVDDELKREILMYRLSETGFESFEEGPAVLTGYIPASSFDPAVVGALLAEHGLRGDTEKIPEQNWNEEWEKNFPPVEIAGKCFVRAPFHEPREGFSYEIIIEPKMSFGTAHHETTSMMLELTMDLAIRGKKVLDMGCGTGILAILAEKMHAREVIAIDNDEWAYNNTRENITRNNAAGIVVILGGAEAIPARRFDIILANINRNILLEQIPVYASHLAEGGELLVSGFYENDLPAIREVSEAAGLGFVSFISRNEWVAAKFAK
jgi:ribosomal protein L11 methyltransferase